VKSHVPSHRILQLCRGEQQHIPSRPDQTLFQTILILQLYRARTEIGVPRLPTNGANV
jgi:hypothetical protein